jgi:hypothetical protein
MALIHLVRSGQITNVVLSRSFALIAVLNAVLNAVLWTLILVAVFAQRDRHANESTGEARMESRDFGRASKPGANLS